MTRLVAVVAGFVVLCSVGVTAPAFGAGGGRGIEVKPESNLAALVQQQPPGTTFQIKAGTYRMQSLQPKSGDAFVGESGAVLSGAQTLTGFSQSGQAWTAKVQLTGSASPHGTCADDHPACGYPEDLFVDDTPLERVGSEGEVGPGKWYLDYGSQTAYVGTDPQGHRVEISVIPHAFSGQAQNVHIEGLTIEKYACPAQDGAVDGKQSSNWVVENNVIELNHGIGLRVGNGMQVLNNKLVHNGQMGVGGGGSNVLVDGNEIAFNNYAGFRFSWEAGGSKFVFTKGLIIRNNNAHDNLGPGLWTDIENDGVLYEHNHTSHNQEAGIFHEISYKGVIRNNVVEDDGFNPNGKTAPWYGAGIIVTASEDVEIYGNTVTNCMNGIVALQTDRGGSKQRGTPYIVRNLYVHDNVITQNQGIAAGIMRSGSTGDAVYNQWNNRFANNQFHLADEHAKAFAWRGTTISHDEWTATVNKR